MSKHEARKECTSVFPLIHVELANLWEWETSWGWAMIGKLYKNWLGLDPQRSLHNQPPAQIQCTVHPCPLHNKIMRARAIDLNKSFYLKLQKDQLCLPVNIALATVFQAAGVKLWGRMRLSDSCIECWGSLLQCLPLDCLEHWRQFLLLSIQLMKWVSSTDMDSSYRLLTSQSQCNVTTAAFYLSLRFIFSFYEVPEAQVLDKL